jgi:2-dehydropantoate 2-reductase
MKVALMGTGSLGTIIGALTAKNGGDILLIDANREHVDAINRNGAKVTGTMEFTAAVKAITPDQMEGIYDVVLYLVKQHHNAIALQQLLPHLGKDSVLCTLQNGTPEEAVAEIVGRERTIGGAVGWGGTWISPGVSMLTSDPSKMTYDLGELDGTITERLKQVADILSLSAHTEISANLLGVRWTKLLVNATFSGMSAVLGCTFGDVMDNEKALACVAHIANETLAVANALGITLEPIQGHDIRVLAFSDAAGMASKYPIFRAVWGPHRLLKASMLQDLEKGRRTEIDAINGVVANSGKKMKISTPINDTVVSLVKEIEAGKRTYSFDNLSQFQLPELP